MCGIWLGWARRWGLVGMLSFGKELCDTCVLLLGTGFLLSAREEVCLVLLVWFAPGVGDGCMMRDYSE